MSKSVGRNIIGQVWWHVVTVGTDISPWRNKNFHQSFIGVKVFKKALKSLEFLHKIQYLLHAFTDLLHYNVHRLGVP